MSYTRLSLTNPLHIYHGYGLAEDCADRLIDRGPEAFELFEQTVEVLWRMGKLKLPYQWIEQMIQSMVKG